MSKEFFIFLEHDKHFFPGDNIKGILIVIAVLYVFI